MIALLLTSCSTKFTNVALDGTLSILTPRPNLSAARFKKEWIVIGSLIQASPTLQDDGIFLHLAVKPGPKPFAVLRPINARLLATPYLEWYWRMTDETVPNSPLQITIGFLDDGSQGENWSLGPIWGPNIPSFSRSLTIEWGPSALQRGSLEVLTSGRKNRPAARYIARGGRENLNRWWYETVDLSALCKEAWPNLNMQNTRVVFAGIVVNPGAGEIAGHIRGLHLTR